jgi:hypothetical protein
MRGAQHRWECRRWGRRQLSRHSGGRRRPSWCRSGRLSLRARAARSRPAPGSARRPVRNAPNGPQTECRRQLANPHEMGILAFFERTETHGWTIHRSNGFSAVPEQSPDPSEKRAPMRLQALGKENSDPSAPGTKNLKTAWPTQNRQEAGYAAQTWFSVCHLPTAHNPRLGCSLPPSGAPKIEIPVQVDALRGGPKCFAR